MPPAPDLAAAIVVGSRRERSQRALDAFARQTARDRMECVVIDVGPADARPLRPPEGMPVHVERRPEVRSWSQARALAVRNATAPVVAFCEEHAFPEPGWAAALIEAHRGPWAAVGYGFESANPGTWVGRAAHVADYGLWLAPVPDGEARLLPGNNCSYRRDVLLGLGERLDPLMGVDYTLQEELRTRGERLALASGAVVRHESAENLRQLLDANRAYCRTLAEDRAWARGWSRARRLAMAAAVPVLVPPMKLGRLVRAVWRRPRTWPAIVESVPALAAVWYAAAFAESAGYAFGAGSARERFLEAELEAVRAAP